MSSDGIFTVAIAVTGNYVINDPVIESRGFVAAENSDKNGAIKTVVQRAVDGYDYENGNKEELTATIKKALKNYFYKSCKQSPLIVVSVLDV